MKIMWASNFSAQSAYASQSRLFAPRIHKSGHPVTVFELSSGVARPYTWSWQDVTLPIIGVMQDALGNDAIKYYVQQHAIDAVITLVDVWKFSPDVWKDIPFYPWCVPADTPIQTTDGQVLTIKEIVDGKLPVKVWGMKDGSLVETEVTHYHSVDANEAGELIEITTSGGKQLLVTADNLVAVDVNNSLKWVRADRLKTGDVVYCNYSIPEQEVFDGNQSSDEGNQQLSAQADRSGMGIHCRDNGWGGDYLNSESLQNYALAVAAHSFYRQYERSTSVMVGGKTGHASKHSQQSAVGQSNARPRYSHISYLLHAPSGGLQGLQHLEEYNPSSHYQKTAWRDSDELHRLTPENFREDVQPAIRRSRNQLLARNQKVELETIQATINRGRLEPRVYDLTTTVGNFFADGILIHNCPIDHHPIPPHVQPPLKAARLSIAMSKFGRDELIGANYPTLYVPLAFDPEIFHPRTDTQRGVTRRALGIGDDTFLVSFVGVNDSTPNRKGIPEMLMAWKLFQQDHPNSVLYMHTLVHGNLPMNSIGGVKIDDLVNSLGIPGNSIRLCDQNRYKAGTIEQNEVANVMGAADVQILLSRGEGFGVPLIEAQACGTPIITTRFAAQEELVFAGWHVDYESEWGWQGAILSKAGVMDTVEKLTHAYNARGNMALRKVAEVGAAGYAIENVMRNYMKPTLDRIAEDVMERLAA